MTPKPLPQRNPALVAIRRADERPAPVYLARLAHGLRRTMREALDATAATLSTGRQNAETLDWAALRYQHTTAIRAALADRYALATANKMILLGSDSRGEWWVANHT